MLRIGLVGCGTHANWAVLPAIRGAADRCELAAIADINPAYLARIELPANGKFADHQRMIAAGGLDALYIATLADTHAAIAIDALNAGLHVLCEKPMATSVEDCHRMVAAAKANHRLLVINFEKRYHAETMQIRQWIDQGHLGQIEAMHIQEFWDGHKTEGELGARRKRLVNLAGSLDCGIHKADCARYWCGGSWKTIHARGRWFGEDLARPPHTCIMAELDNGVLVTLNASFAYGAYMTPNVYSNALTIVGTRGVVNSFEDRTGPSTVNLIGQGHSAVHMLSDTSHTDVMTKLLRDFAYAADGKRPPREVASGEDGLMAQIFVEEANRQSVENRLR